MEASKKTLGAYLREAREMRGLTLEEISKETKISRRFLEALENEDWEILPAEVYVRGYLRCYAEAVGLDPKEVLLRYRAAFKQEGRDREEGERRTLKKSLGIPWAWILLFIGIILLGYLLWIGR